MIQRTTQAATEKPPSESENLVEAILLLHAMATPNLDIVKRVRVDMATCIYVIEHKRLPARQMSFGFADEPAVRPLDDEVGR